MRRTYVVGVALFAAAACGGDESTNDRLGQAFCADLENGLTPAQIVAGAPADTFDGPQDAAATAAVWVEEFCGRQLDENGDLRSWLAANNIPLDG